MPRRFVDLSVAIENDIIADPPGYGPKVTYQDHKSTAPFVAARYEGLKPDDLPRGEGFAAELVQLSSHSGTHVDAPYHYTSTMQSGEPAAKIDELPLDWFFGPGVKLDFRHFPDGYVCSALDVESELNRIGHKLQAGDVVLVNTSAGQRYGQPDFVEAGCGMGREATLYLTSRGVRLTGTDCWSWDVHYKYMNEAYQRTKDVSVIWPGHRSGGTIPYSHMEKLHNLEKLPASGFLVSAFPVKIRGASAGWTRAVAIFED